jgi:hypothetical protein
MYVVTMLAVCVLCWQYVWQCVLATFNQYLLCHYVPKIPTHRYFKDHRGLRCTWGLNPLDCYPLLHNLDTSGWSRRVLVIGIMIYNKKIMDLSFLCSQTVFGRYSEDGLPVCRSAGLPDKKAFPLLAKVQSM